MAWVLGVLRALETDRDVRAHCQWRRHPLLYERDGRFMTSSSAASVRASDPARLALDLARQPVPYATLRTVLLEQTNGTGEQVDALLTELWEHGLLLTDLKPRLTGPAATAGTHVAGLLRHHQPATANAVEDLLDRMRDFDKAPPAEAPARLAEITEKAKSISPVHGAAFHTDLRRSMAADELNEQVGLECARAAELLLRLTPAPTGSADLANYKRSFLARYGEDREVALTELFDPVRGLGPMPHTHASKIEISQQKQWSAATP
jgi:hypothetical protein